MSFKRNLDWVPNGSFGSPTVFAWANVDGAFDSVSPVLSRLLLTPSPDFSTVTGSQPSGYPNVRQVATAKRVRGTVWHGISAQAPLNASIRCALFIHERVHMAIYDLSNGDIATPSDDFTTGADANERYLWARQSLYDVSVITQTGSASTVWLNAVGAAQTGSAAGDRCSHLYWTDVDVQANRRINEGEALLYSVQYRIVYAGTPAVNSLVNLTHQPFLRTLARV